MNPEGGNILNLPHKFMAGGKYLSKQYMLYISGSSYFFVNWLQNRSLTLSSFIGCKKNLPYVFAMKITLAPEKTTFHTEIHC